MRGAAWLAVLLAFTVSMPAPAPVAIGQPDLPLPAAPDPCPADAPVRAFAVVALQVPVVYNRWGDFDPQGQLLVLAQDEQAVLQEVADSFLASAQGTAQRAATHPGLGMLDALGYAFPTGLAGVPNLDPVQPSPLVQPFLVRAHVGECVELDVTNHLGQPVGLHIHRAITPPGQGGAFGAELPDLALPGQSRAFRAYIPDLPGMEGAHVVHSHADARDQTRHGLFGAILAEPKGATWTAPDGLPMDNGAEAIITQPGAPDFREFVLLFHDEIALLNHQGNPLPLLSPYGEYGPGTKGINLRSEPFMDRFLAHDALGPQGTGELDRGHDKSLAYSSYTYGDPATPVVRAYVGDPAKIRLVNVGPGQHHVFHLHGGGDRWRASPVSDDPQMRAGLVKHNPVQAASSERLDVQNVGPGESFNLEVEGGAGGTQQSAGDFLYHCHIVEHYVAGMIGMWRVHNTLQPGLAELPDRAGVTPAPVDSLGLLGRTMPDGTVITQDNLADWVRPQLPPPGVPAPNDASVWDWTLEDTPEGPRFLGEPEDTRSWVNHHSAHPGERPALQFDPWNGRLSYPWMQPHLGKRPPFAPQHGPAPYLGPDVLPGRPDGLCPADARHLRYDVVAVSTPVRFDAQDVDPDGQVFVLADDKAAVLSGANPARSLVLRANAGDCVDVLLTSQLALAPEQAENGASKVNMHIHLVQFDVQASDGVITGFNDEQSVRSAAVTGTTLAEAAAAGATRIRVQDATQVRAGTLLGIGLTEPDAELREVRAVEGDEAVLATPLERDHAAGALVGTEFVRYRWYADVELGMVYWHDHVDGLHSWRHGLFGGLVVEPRGSAWTDPDTGGPVRSGPVADITGYRCFREMVAQVQDNTATVGGRNLTSINLRSNPLDARDPVQPFAGAVSTDVLRAYAGDPVEIRLLYAGQSTSAGVGTFTVQGHRFPFEQRNPGSRLVDSVSFGESSQHNLALDGGAGGPFHLPGDYLLGMAQPDLLRRGAWTLLRVLAAAQPGLRALPDHPPDPGVLPDGPLRTYDLVAMRADVTFNPRSGLTAARDLFVLERDAPGIANGTLAPGPLVLRALPGERIEVRLRNDLDHAVSLAAGLLPGDAGVPVGDADARVVPGATRTFTWFADRELGVARLASWARPDDTLRGLAGALVVEPAGSTFSVADGPRADLVLADGTPVREHVLLYASDDPTFEASVMPYSEDVHGIVSVGLRSEPLAARLGGTLPAVTPGGEPLGGLGISTCQVNAGTCGLALPGGKSVHAAARSPAVPFAFSSALFGDPATPILDAQQGQRVVVRALGAAGDQLQVHGLAGHWWRRDPAMPGSELVDSATLGPGESSNAWFTAGAAGDYLYGAQRGAFQEAGAWGILRVSP